MLNTLFKASLALVASLGLAASPALADGHAEEQAEPAESAAPAPGTILLHGAIVGDLLIENAASGTLFTYASTDGIDGTSPITVTGALYLPEGEAPEGGWPLIAWSHGTVGVGDSCAPTVNGRSQRDLTYLSNWLAKGYAIVASDYQGLGSDGLHPYLATRPMAYSNLDAIRAVQSGDFPVSKAVVVTGQSQGASAAIATAGYAADYAPEIDLRAISATGVPYFPPVVQQMLAMQDQDTPSPNVSFNLYLLTLAEELDPDFNLEAAIGPELWPEVSKAYELCVFDLMTSSMEAGITMRQISNPVTLAQQPAIFEAISYPTLALSVPAFVGSGEADTVTPLPMQQLFVAAACAAGSTIEARQYPGASHDGGLLDSIGHVEAFVAKAFAGEEISGNCR